VWLLLLVILGYALSGRQERHTRDRLAESMESKVTLGGIDLALVRGRLSIDKLSIKRDDPIGHMAIDVKGVRCELAPLGLALFDRDCRDLVIDGLSLEVSTAALFKMQRPPKSKPIRADHVEITNAKLAFMPSAFLPNLGKIAIEIDHVESGPTVMRTPLSWLFTLQSLRAKFDLPAGISVVVGYRNGVLSATGSVFGSAPVELPLTIPSAESVKDAQGEIELLIKMAKDAAEKLVAKRAEDWLRSKLP